MASIDSLLAALDERVIAQQVGLRHDEARMRYRLEQNTVRNYDEFIGIVADYYNYHCGCMSGGSWPSVEAGGQAKEILDEEYRRKGSDMVGALTDACDGTNGGMRVVLDTIADALKAKSVERYIRDVFDRHVGPRDWDTKVEMIRQFIAQCGADLSSSIRADQPERYARDYQDLIRSRVEGLRRTSSMFRRL